MLEAGQRPEAQIPPPETLPRLPPPFINDAARVTQWPLPDDRGIQSRAVLSQPGSSVANGPRPSGAYPPSRVPPLARGPPPPRPRRPGDTPCSSIYSERSTLGHPSNPRPIRHPPQSFSQRLPFPGHDGTTLNPATTTSLTSCMPATTSEFNRQSTASSVGTIPDFPLPHEPRSAYIQPRGPPAGTNPSQYGGRQMMTHVSSVSPIPEEAFDSRRVYKGSFASSKAIPSSWGSGPAESEILGTYLDDGFGNTHEAKPFCHDSDAGLVRQASLGKRGKPSLRTIQKSNPSSYVSSSEGHMGTMNVPLVKAVPGADRDDTNTQDRGGNCTLFRDSTSSTSSAGSPKGDPEKGPIYLEVSRNKPGSDGDMGALEKGLDGLPMSGPKMSDKRSSGRRPPRLDIDAVRDAEARGSLTSLSDLIRRATKLASRLDHGRTASRNDLCDDGMEFKRPPKQRFRNSGSFSGILASFPPPGPGTSEGRSSWPVFFKRSNLQKTASRDPEADQKKPHRRCCGMSPCVFALVCVIVTVIIILAILLPIFLIVVPQQGESSTSSCAETTPCRNGGVSVSSGDFCSCVCTNGYTGSQCTVDGDGSCVTTEVNSENATIGSEIPRLFEESQNDFSIPLDQFTIMALFSQSNVSCMTENALVSFREVSTKSRRSLPISLQPDLEPVVFNPDEPSDPTTLAEQIKTPAPRDSITMVNGIGDNNSLQTREPPTATAPLIAARKMQSKESGKSVSVPSKAVDFARIAVLYIFQQTGALDSAIKSQENIQKYLAGPYSNSNKTTYSMVVASRRYTLDFDKFSISTPDGKVVGDGTN